MKKGVNRKKNKENIKIYVCLITELEKEDPKFKT